MYNKISQDFPQTAECAVAPAEVPDALQGIEHRISYLSDRLDVLLLRIEPVLRNNNDKQQVAEAKTVMASCDLGRRIYYSKANIESLADRVDVALERLEL